MLIVDPVDILINVKDGILKFYIENGYIYCESTKTKDRGGVGNA